MLSEGFCLLAKDFDGESRVIHADFHGDCMFSRDYGMGKLQRHVTG